MTINNDRQIDVSAHSCSISQSNCTLYHTTLITDPASMYFSCMSLVCLHVSLVFYVLSLCYTSGCFS